MAIAFDNAAALGQTTSAVNQTLTASYTITGSNTCLVVWASQTSSAGDWISGVTWGGVALTRVNRQAFFAGEGTDMSMYVLFGASAGTANIIISSSSGGNSIVIVGMAASYTGVGTGPADASTTHTGTSVGTSYATTLTTVADNCWTVAGFACNEVSGNSGGTGTTLRFGNSSTGFGVLDSNAVVHPAGSNTLTLSNAGGLTAMSNMLSLAPVSGGGAVLHSLSSLGVGA